MAVMSATDPSDFFKSLDAARLANKDFKPMSPADLKQAELIWRKWLPFCNVQAVDLDAVQSAGIARFCQTIGSRSSFQKTLPVTLSADRY